ncbi:MAG: HAD family hydrolase [Gemmataceae bacterium]
MKQPATAVLFDFDGTLADGYVAITNSINFVRSSRGLPNLAAEQIRPLVGRGLETLLSEVGTGNVAADVATYRDHYAQHMMEGTVLFSAARPLISQLRASGVKLGVCSNKLAKFTNELLVRLGIADMFGAVVGPEHVIRPKPAPDMLLAAVEKLGAIPVEIIYIGDMSIDVAAGRAAGMTVWTVATGSESMQQLQSAQPDRLFSDLGEVQRAFGFETARGTEVT